jgi:ABC-type sugar transport system ATPase subunit
MRSQCIALATANTLRGRALYSPRARMRCSRGARDRLRNHSAIAHVELRFSASDRRGRHLSTAAPDPPRSALAELRGIHKSFRGIPVLRGIDVTLFGGEIHAWVGENGAGKSTLARALAGFHPDYGGEIRIGGAATRIDSPSRAAACGIALIQQDAQLVPALSASENLFLGRELRGRLPGLVDRRAMLERARERLRALGFGLDPERSVAALAPGERQQLEIAKGLLRESTLLIFDEPTAALTLPEIGELHARLRALRERGVGIVYVSHHLKDVLALADRISVLRDGELVAQAPRSDWDETRLVRAMVGREVTRATQRPAVQRATALLRGEGLGCRGRFEAIDFAVPPGEILGLAGLAGAGRSSLLRALFGLLRIDRGSIELDGEPLRMRAPRDALARGVAFVPEDRSREGLVPELPAAENIALLRPPGLRWRPWIEAAREREHVASAAAQSGLADELLSRAARRLSGGNQQKTVLARALLRRPRVLLLDEPTRAIDVSAKAEIHARIRALADTGSAVLLASSELPELLACCDRILVLRSGRLAAEFDAALASEDALLAAAAGATDCGARA